MRLEKHGFIRLNADLAADAEDGSLGALQLKQFVLASRVLAFFGRT